MSLTFRKIRETDLQFVVQLLANDKLGKLREDFQKPLPEKYLRAFDAIKKDKNQELMVAENEEGEIIGTLQLSFIQYKFSIYSFHKRDIVHLR